MRFEKKTDFYKLSFSESDDIFQTLDNGAIYHIFQLLQILIFMGL